MRVQRWMRILGGLTTALLVALVAAILLASGTQSALASQAKVEVPPQGLNRCLWP